MPLKPLSGHPSETQQSWRDRGKIVQHKGSELMKLIGDILGDPRNQWIGLAGPAVGMGFIPRGQKALAGLKSAFKHKMGVPLPASPMQSTRTGKIAEQMAGGSQRPRVQEILASQRLAERPASGEQFAQTLMDVISSEGGIAEARRVLKGMFPDLDGPGVSFLLRQLEEGRVTPAQIGHQIQISRKSGWPKTLEGESNVMMRERHPDIIEDSSGFNQMAKQVMPSELDKLLKGKLNKFPPGTKRPKVDYPEAPP